jgi:hypothetical protein
MWQKSPGETWRSGRGGIVETLSSGQRFLDRSIVKEQFHREKEPLLVGDLE